MTVNDQEGNLQTEEGKANIFNSILILINL